MTMNTFTAATLLLGALTVAGCNTTTQAEYEVGQAVLKTDPEIRRTITANCIKDIDNDSAADRANMAAIMSVPVSRVSATFCARVVRAVANNRLSYADIKSAERSGNYEKFIKVLQGR